MIVSEQTTNLRRIAVSPVVPDLANVRSARTFGLKAGSFLNGSAFAFIRQKSILNGCKWDPQVGDVDTLAPFPLIMRRSLWRKLAGYAEQMTAEAISAEFELSSRPDLIRQLGLPRPLMGLLSEKSKATPAAGRIIRFDFHPTTEGWRISEANSDVPGGFTESSYFTALVAEQFPPLQPAGNPAVAWCDALASRRHGADNLKIALLSAPGYMEDQQVVAFLAALLRKRIGDAFLARPEQIIWRNGFAHLATPWHEGPVDAIVRFYQAEWLSRLPASTGWRKLFRDGNTPVANPAVAVMSESKRFPLVWDKLSSPLPAWRALLPETRDPRDAPWVSDENWLVKAAMCNTGDSITVRQWLAPVDWLRARVAVTFAPQNWVAQRRFESVPIQTPVGPRHVCIGVYTINGRAGGAYARISELPLIDFSAVDIALLVEEDD
jgi:hypothetical protein